MLDHLHAVIMAGGRGTRFWPLSTRRRPKQLLRITGERTMIQETAARLRPLVPPERVWVVTGTLEAPELRRQLDDLADARILIEPIGRNTAPCIALAAHHLVQHDPEAVMAVLPADHDIADPATFRRALAAAAAAAHEQPVLLTLGMKPQSPETGYGYIEQGIAAGTYDGFEVFAVDAFREKPDRALAEELVRGGRHLWNAGIFVWRARIILEEIERHLPIVARELQPVAAALGAGGDWRAALAAAYARIEGISIDYGVMERSHRVWVMPCSFGWSDVGSWAALRERRPQDADGNATVGDAVLIDARRTLAVSEDRLVAAIGVDDLVIVVAGQAILICPRERAQDVREVVAELERRGREDLL